MRSPRRHGTLSTFKRKRSGMSVNSSKESRQRREAFDTAFDAYLDWRERCDAVQSAYAQWTHSARADAARAFGAYERALDREEGAANAYAAVITRVAELVEPELSHQLAWVSPGMWSS
jgi:hypothetical protein